MKFWSPLALTKVGNDLSTMKDSGKSLIIVKPKYLLIWPISQDY